MLSLCCGLLQAACTQGEARPRKGVGVKRTLKKAAGRQCRAYAQQGIGVERALRKVSVLKAL